MGDNMSADKPKSTSLSTMLQAALPEVQNSLPVSADQGQLEQIAKRFNRVAMTAVRMDEHLQVCEFRSIVGCVIQGASLGLELNGVMGQAYMIPYKNSDKGIIEATFQLGYQGMVDLIYRHEKVAVAYAEVVRKGDSFEYQLGTSPFITHLPFEDNNEEITHAYAVIGLTTGAHIICVWTTEQINNHLRHFSKAFKAKKGPAMDQYSWPAMAKKTVFLQASKWAPKSIETEKMLTSYAPSEPLKETGKPEVISEEDIEASDEFDLTEAERQGKIHEAEVEEESAKEEETKKEQPTEAKGEKEPENKSNKATSKDDLTTELLELIDVHLTAGHISQGEYKSVVNWLEEYKPTAIEIRKKIQDWEEALKRRGYA